MGGTGANPTGTASDGWTFTVSVDEDFGDAPGGFDPTAAASHIVGGVFMGTAPTADNVATTNPGTITPSPLASASATGDTDNGVTIPTLVRGAAANIDVAVTGAGGRLQGWIDWADDGSWATAGDRIATNAVDGGAGDGDGVANGVIRLAVTVPAGAALTETIARFRFSTTTGLGTTGLAADGEVEDYALTVLPQRADLSLTKSVSNATPNNGSTITYTLTVASAASPASTGTATGITVQDTLPAGVTFVSAAGTGTYNSGTGVWSVGSLAPGANAAITITATVSATTGTITNIAQISASSLADPDSTVNNGVTTEDDYATASFTVAEIFNCPVGSTATGSGFASSGTGANLGQIFWLDWSCGVTTAFPTGSTVNKSWNAGDGLVITGQVTNITGGAAVPYVTGNWTGDALDDLYNGVNPIGLGGANGDDVSYRLALSATLNGQPVSVRFVAADAEDTGGAGAETMAITTTGSAWQLLENAGSLSLSLAGTNASWTGPNATNNGTLIVQTSGSSVQLNASTVNQGGEHFAFGVFTPFDYSDAPLTGTSYASANHRTISAFDLGAAFTNEGAAYDSPTASGDVDDGVTLPATMTVGVPVTISVAAPNFGYLSAWFDWNADGDFADAGEKVATDIVNGGAGDTDGAANGVITFSVTPTTAFAQTFARFRLSSNTGAPSSGLHGFGEIEDYRVVILNKAVLALAKSHTTWNDGVNPVFNLPGTDVTYSLTASNTTNGQPDANSVFLYDTLPAEVTFFNGDADGAGAGTNAVNFVDSGSGLTFTYATDVAYSNAAAAPANFAACTYTPTAGYDVNVKHVCFNPKGTMTANTGSGTPAFTVSFRTRIK